MSEKENSTDTAPVEAPVASQHPNSLFKPKREHYRRERADNLKAPQHLEDPESGEVKTFAVFVTKNGEERRVPCTPEVWARIDGHPVQGLPHPGLDQLLHNTFMIYFGKNESGDEVVVDLDVLPKSHEYQHGFGIEGEEKIKNVTVKIDQRTGSIEVEKCPRAITDNTIDRIVSALNKQDTLYPGLQLGGTVQPLYASQAPAGRYEIVGIAGNHVEIAVRPG